MLPPGKVLTFRVRTKAQNCLPEASNRVIQYAAAAYLIPAGANAQTCFINAKPSTATIKGFSKNPECPSDAIPGAPLGPAEEAAAFETATDLILAPAVVYIQPNTPEQNAVRAQQRAAKAAWQLGSDVGTPDAVDDPLVQSASASADEVRAASTLTVDYAVHCCVRVWVWIGRGTDGNSID